jgi:diphthine synthase
MPGLSLENLTKVIGKTVEVLSRVEVEERAEELILSRAKFRKVGFLVPGDPMVATTHVDLRLRAHNAGIHTRIIHASSVISAAAGVSGLQAYKFGRIVTVPCNREGGLPESVYEAINGNLASGLHSLVLLEIDVENNRHVAIPGALEQLLATSKRKSGSRINSDSLVVGIARLEAPDMTIKAGRLREIMQTNFGKPPFALIFPAQLHFVEAEALEAFCDLRGTGK